MTDAQQSDNSERGDQPGKTRTWWHPLLAPQGCEVSRHEPGVFRVGGLPFTTWLVETDVMAERGQPVLSLVSRVFLNDRRSIIERLAHGGQGALAHYRCMLQQVIL